MHIEIEGDAVRGLVCWFLGSKLGRKDPVKCERVQLSGFKFSSSKDAVHQQ